LHFTHRLPAGFRHTCCHILFWDIYWFTHCWIAWTCTHVSCLICLAIPLHSRRFCLLHTVHFSASFIYPLSGSHLQFTRFTWDHPCHAVCTDITSRRLIAQFFAFRSFVTCSYGLQFTPADTLRSFGLFHAHYTFFFNSYVLCHGYTGLAPLLPRSLFAGLLDMGSADGPVPPSRWMHFWTPLVSRGYARVVSTVLHTFVVLLLHCIHIHVHVSRDHHTPGSLPSRFYTTHGTVRTGLNTCALFSPSLFLYGSFILPCIFIADILLAPPFSQVLLVLFLPFSLWLPHFIQLTTIFAFTLFTFSAFLCICTSFLHLVHCSLCFLPFRTHILDTPGHFCIFSFGQCRSHIWVMHSASRSRTLGLYCACSLTLLPTRTPGSRHAFVHAPLYRAAHTHLGPACCHIRRICCFRCHISRAAGLLLHLRHVHAVEGQRLHASTHAAGLRTDVFTDRLHLARIATPPYRLPLYSSGCAERCTRPGFWTFAIRTPLLVRSLIRAFLMFRSTPFRIRLSRCRSSARHWFGSRLRTAAAFVTFVAVLVPWFGLP